MSWQTKRSMSPKQYAWAIKQLGLNISSAARFLNVAIRTSSRYKHGLADIPAPTALLLWGMIERGDVPDVPRWTKGY